MMNTKQEIQDWILKNCVDSDGNIVMSDLDFGDKIVFLNRMKAGVIYQSEHEANGIFQNEHKANGIFQSEHEARVIYQWGNKANEISQWGHKCDNVKEGEHIKKLTLEEENERLKKKLNDKA